MFQNLVPTHIACKRTYYPNVIPQSRRKYAAGVQSPVTAPGAPVPGITLKFARASWRPRVAAHVVASVTRLIPSLGSGSAFSSLFFQIAKIAG